MGLHSETAYFRRCIYPTSTAGDESDCISETAYFRRCIYPQLTALTVIHLYYANFLCCLPQSNVLKFVLYLRWIKKPKIVTDAIQIFALPLFAARSLHTLDSFPCWHQSFCDKRPVTALFHNGEESGIVIQNLYPRLEPHQKLISLINLSTQSCTVTFSLYSVPVTVHCDSVTIINHVHCAFSHHSTLYFANVSLFFLASELSKLMQCTITKCLPDDYDMATFYSMAQIKIPTGQNAISRHPCEIFIPKFLGIYGRDPGTILKFKKIILVFTYA